MTGESGTGPAARAAILLATLALVAGAGAPVADARVSDREAARAVEVGHSFWSDVTDESFRGLLGSCRPGTVRILWLPDLGTAMATASLLGCLDPLPTISLEAPTVRRLDEDHACGVITHEYGHLLGFRHNTRRGSIMYSSSTSTTAGPQVPAAATWDRVYRRRYCGRFG